MTVLMFVGAAMAGCGWSGLIGGSGGGRSLPDGRSGPTPRDDERKPIYWTGVTDVVKMKWEKAPDWAKQVDFRGVPVRDDFIFIYEEGFVNKIREQGLGYTRHPEFDAEYSATLRRVFDERVPDPAFDGIICFDFEAVPFVWRDNAANAAETAKEGRAPWHSDLWIKWTKEHEPGLLAGRSEVEQERVLKRTYDGAARLWLTKTFEEARRIRPRARFAMYGIPGGSRYFHYAGKDPNVWRQFNDSMQWLTDLQDVTVLVLYQNRKVQQKGDTPRPPLLTYQEGVDHITENITEARRIAPRKPLLALVGFWSEDGSGGIAAWRNEPVLDMTIAQTAKAGADGLVIWHFFADQKQFDEYQRMLDERAIPLIREYWGR